MTNASFRTINALFEELDDEYPDKSSEWLFQMTIDVYKQRHEITIDSGDIAQALLFCMSEES